ncbi:class I SAM-dependent methyltransferase [Saccharospirillum salsuginis]|uniref:Methyltransferase n=1 Tax=Saccharospirillum salsuginis TaxID=418750 RepID=A0A918KTA7_9GAMM|nr:class I SAM-dependent methyltransferase [Saccharospirillum salsuginis]GGX73513.1 methyltransferase [Saccharospirillum salsuginis]
MNVTQDQVKAGQAVYTKRTLNLYDFIVLTVSNPWIWKCPTPRLIDHYNRHVTANHLDIGIGTGYFPDKCDFPSDNPRIGLMDLNSDTLAYASARIIRYRPEVYAHNVLEPLFQEIEPFDSIGVNYLLHCVPGSIETKAVMFDHLKPVMTDGATVFGSTLLQGDVPRSGLAKRLMAFYNKKGIFSNTEDTLAGLESALNQRFTDVTIERVGCAALFSARA